jgi:hypothetical protein
MFYPAKWTFRIETVLVVQNPFFQRSLGLPGFQPLRLDLQTKAGATGILPLQVLFLL